MIRLDPADRPPELQSKIDSVFESVSTAPGRWLFNGGCSTYDLCDIREHLLMKKIIQAAPAGQKKFNVIDIGSGVCQWAFAMAAYLDEQKDLPAETHVNIVSVTGDKYLKERVVKTGRCTLYNIGAFKIEELTARLKEERLNLENGVDLAISSWCFRHLPDPAGTFVQTYNLLRPGTGFFLFDGFEFLYEDEKLNKGSVDERMTRLLLDTKAPFVTTYCGASNSMNHFLLKRPDDAPCRLPMSYLEMILLDKHTMIGSKTMVRFKREGDDEKIYYVPKQVTVGTDRWMSGDQKLHDWVKRNDLVFKYYYSWKPLREKDLVKERPPLQLEDVESLDVSDYKGDTHLHFAVREQNWELFDLLLAKGANFKHFNSRLFTPLHEAAACDKEGRFIQRLIAMGAGLNADADYHDTPVKVAIENRNLKAVELLLKANCKIYKEDFRELQSPFFASLHEIIVEPEENYFE